MKMGGEEFVELQELFLLEDLFQTSLTMKRSSPTLAVLEGGPGKGVEARLVSGILSMGASVGRVQLRNSLLLSIGFRKVPSVTSLPSGFFGSDSEDSKRYNVGFITLLEILGVGEM